MNLAARFAACFASCLASGLALVASAGLQGEARPREAPTQERVLSASGGSLTSRGEPDPDHAWIALRETLDKPVRRDQTRVFHIPPREESGNYPERDGAARRARYVRTLDGWPDALASSGQRLSLAMVDRPGAPAGFVPPPSRPTGILSVRALRDHGRWTFHPGERMESRPALPAGALVCAMAETGVGLAALVIEQHAPSLRLLHGGAWEEITLPRHDLGSLEHARLCGLEDGFVLCVSQRGEFAIWHAAVKPGEEVPFVYGLGDDELLVGPPAPAKPVSAEWTRWSAPTVTADVAWELSSCADQVVLAISRSNEIGLHVASRGESGGPSWREAARIEDAAASFALAPQARHGRMIVTWLEELTGPQGDTKAELSTPTIHYAEVSVATGALLDRGEFELSGPATRGDLVGVLVLLAWIIGLVVVVAVRPGENTSLMLPADASLAEPARRMIAGVIDVMLALLGAGLVLGSHPVEVLTSSATTLLTTSDGQALLGITLGLGVGVGTICEWALGRSPGKLLTGCVVADLSRDPAPGRTYRRLSFLRSFLRNFVKWCLPPAGVIGVLGVGVRHRGDEYTKAGVITFGPGASESDHSESD